MKKWVYIYATYENKNSISGKNCHNKRGMISMDKTMLLSWIMEEISVNVGEIIYKHIHMWVIYPHDTRPFPHLIEQLYLKACHTIKNLLKTVVKDGIWTITSLNRMINLHKNKAKDKCLKTKKTEKIDEDDEVEIEDEEERESEKQTLVISKRKCVDEASGSKKREKKPKAKEFWTLSLLPSLSC